MQAVSIRIKVGLTAFFLFCVLVVAGAMYLADQHHPDPTSPMQSTWSVAPGHELIV